MNDRATPVEQALATIRADVMRWPGVTAVKGEFGGNAFRVGASTIGRLHDDGVLEVCVGPEAPERAAAAGRHARDTADQAVGWVNQTIVSPADVAPALRLLRRAYESVEGHRTAHGADAPRDPIDEAVEESFPASDPPAVGHTD
jgi:Family of unknown function (DUF5519)